MSDDRSVGAVDADDDAPVSWREAAVARSLDSARTRAESRVQRFLDAALELMADSDGKEFTVQEVVERSGQSLRSFYQYFGGKHELLLALFEESVRTTAERLREDIAKESEPLERLHQLVLGYYRICRPSAKSKAAKKTAAGPAPVLVEFAQQLLTAHPTDAARAYIPLVTLFDEVIGEAIDARRGAIRRRPRVDLGRGGRGDQLQHLLLDDRRHPRAAGSRGGGRRAVAAAVPRPPGPLAIPAQRDGSMRAAVCRVHGAPEVVVVDDIPVPEVGPDQVRVGVRAAAVNFPDVLLIAGTYQVTVPPPFVPGSELAGVVEEVGAAVEGLAVGDRVTATTMVGAFAEQAVVSGRIGAARSPMASTCATAAASGVAHRTAYHVLRSVASVQPGEEVVVLGAGGGVGLAAVQLGTVLGATVTAVASSPEKLEAAASHGAVRLVDHRDGDLRSMLREQPARGRRRGDRPRGGRPGRTGAAIAALGRALRDGGLRVRHRPADPAQPGAAQGRARARLPVHRLRDPRPRRARAQRAGAGGAPVDRARRAAHRRHLRPRRRRVRPAARGRRAGDRQGRDRHAPPTEEPLHDHPAPSRAHPGDRVVLDLRRRRRAAHPGVPGLRHARPPAGAHLPVVPQPSVGARRRVRPRHGGRRHRQRPPVASRRSRRPT